VSARRKKVALALAATADALQLVLFPPFFEGSLSIPDDVLDAAVAVALAVTIGLRWQLAVWPSRWSWCRASPYSRA
jgi:hypothetical protein